MKKEQPVSDKKSRTTKKATAKKTTKKVTKRPSKSDCMDGEIIIRMSLIKDLQAERDTYKALAEKLGTEMVNNNSDKLQQELNAYKDCWPKLKKIAKFYKKTAENASADYEKSTIQVLKYNKLCGILAMTCDFYERHVSIWARLFHRKRINELKSRLNDVTLETFYTRDF